jgi:hypothetical protein
MFFGFWRYVEIEVGTWNYQVVTGFGFVSKSWETEYKFGLIFSLFFSRLMDFS